MQTIGNNTKNEIMCCNMINLQEGEAEFVRVGKKLKTFLSDDVVDFEHTPAPFLNLLRESIGNPAATIEELKHHAGTYLGGFDKNPDAKLKTRTINYTETMGRFDNGAEITRGEFAVLEHIDKDAKDIAEIIFRTKSTVENQIYAMKIKSGLTGKQLIAFAERKGYLVCYS